MRKLERCPCCGGKAELQRVGCSFIRCLNCGLETKVYHSIKKAFDAWNRRYKDEQTK